MHNMPSKQDVLSVLSGSGLDQLLLRSHDALFNTTGQIANDIRDFEYTGESKGSILFPMIPGYRTVCLRYCILADAFRRRGYEPLLLVDDGMLDAPIERTIDQNEAPTAQTTFYRRRIPAKFGLDTIPISSLLQDNCHPTVDQSTTDIDIPRFARGSTRKYLKRYSLDLDNPDVRPTYERFLRAGHILEYALAAIFERNDIVCTVAHEPYYVQGGVPLAVSKANGVPAYSQVWGFKRGHLLFGQATNRSLLPQYSDEHLVERALSDPLSEDECAEVEAIMRNRELGTNMSVDYSAHTNRSLQELDESNRALGVFTNLLWDASLEPDQAVYGDVFEWLDDTMSELGGTDVSVVVKTHPAEAKFGTSESVTEWFDEKSAVPGNFTVLPPDTDIDTYALLRSLDAAIVYNSTVGLEAAYRGLPVVVAGDTHYRGFGFTIDPESKDAYRCILGDLHQTEFDSSTELLARRYCHLLFVKKHVPFRFCQREQGAQQQFQEVDATATGPGAKPFDTIVDAMVDGRPVLNPEYDHLSNL